jgi:hypothetical protein
MKKAGAAWKLLCITGFLYFNAAPPAFAGKEHDIHVCLSEIRWNPQTLSFEVAVKIFIDDLELALSRDKVEGLLIGSPNESAEADAHIAGYIKKHFSILLDGVSLPGEMIGKEVAEDYQAIWCYIEFEGFSAPKKCTISNTILFELYDDQRNIMDIRMTSGHKDFRIFDPDQHSWTYTF